MYVQGEPIALEMQYISEIQGLCVNMGRLIFYTDDGFGVKLMSFPDDYLPFVNKNIERTVKGLDVLNSLSGGEIFPDAEDKKQ